MCAATTTLTHFNPAFCNAEEVLSFIHRLPPYRSTIATSSTSQDPHTLRRCVQTRTDSADTSIDLGNQNRISIYGRCSTPFNNFSNSAWINGDAQRGIRVTTTLRPSRQVPGSHVGQVPFASKTEVISVMRAGGVKVLMNLGVPGLCCKLNRSAGKVWIRRNIHP